MDYRDSSGYFQADVLQVLGRGPSDQLQSSTSSYGLQGTNFVDFEEENESEWTTDLSVSDDGGGESEWEEAKRVLYMSVVGVLLPMTFRYIGRRLTFSVWTKILTAYFRFK
ncbi:hypothetical protein GGH95_002406 [Coemansia sp. RSA 1836]|nr:hypothetical protein IWW47_001268 [Coemansia sp. RSA 2052]KAJ2580785.1 hypothetical protein GGH95_002406 [Coemansia sp. RSA 1836]